MTKPTPPQCRDIGPHPLVLPCTLLFLALVGLALVTLVVAACQG